MFFRSLGGRRAGWIAEAVKDDAICNASGSLNEGVHEGMEGVLFSIRNLESRQLVLSGVFVVYSDQ